MNSAHLLIPDDIGRSEASPRPNAVTAGRLAGETMGTTWSAVWYGSPGLEPATIEKGFEDVFASTIRDMSSWDSASVLSRYNRLAPGQTLRISRDFACVLDTALTIARRSDGAFDPCLGSAVVRGGFGPVGIQSATAGTLCGPEAWALIKPSGETLLQPGGVVLDVSGIAKGCAVDRMVRVLLEAGAAQFLVEIGGEFVGRGVKPDSSPWWVDLENPLEGSAPWRIALCGHALATSGDYRQMRSVDGVTLSHIVPAPDRTAAFGDLACVSVLRANCTEADAWATALFASGDAGLALADAQGIAALFQYRDAPPRLSASMAVFLD